MAVFSTLSFLQVFEPLSCVHKSSLHNKQFEDVRFEYLELFQVFSVSKDCSLKDLKVIFNN